MSTNLTLKEMVRAYLDKRQDTAPPDSIVKWAGDPLEAEQVGASERDLLLQFFMERRISRTELIAGRRWQYYAHNATIQPARCALGQRDGNSFYWQPDGELSDLQHEAMRVRRVAFQAFGKGRFDLLDSLLDVDVGRSDVLQQYGLAAHACLDTLCYLLKEVAVCFGLSTRIVRFDPAADANQIAQNDLTPLMANVSGVDAETVSDLEPVIPHVEFAEIAEPIASVRPPRRGLYLERRSPLRKNGNAKELSDLKEIIVADKEYGLSAEAKVAINLKTQEWKNSRKFRRVNKKVGFLERHQAPPGRTRKL